jgi:hypothetical protein
VIALELGPTSLKTVEGWATVHGWPQVHAWQGNAGRRIHAKLLPLPGDESVPEETPLERQFHQAMSAAYPPDPEAVEMLREKLMGDR